MTNYNVKVVYKQEVAAIPAGLQSQTTWLNWKQLSDGRKVPTNKLGAATGYEDRESWLPLQDAIHNASLNPSIHLGISLTKSGLLLEMGYLWCLDFDGFACGSQIDDGLMFFIRKLATYVEDSPSGTGFKAFFTSDKQPQKMSVIKFGPSEFAAAHPDVKKYKNRAVEVFSEGRFLAFTGKIFDDNTPVELRLIPAEELDNLLNDLNQWAINTGGCGWSRPPKFEEKPCANTGRDSAPKGYAKPFLEDMAIVLQFVDAEDEQVYSDVANGLARTYGEDGRGLFLDYCSRSTLKKHKESIANGEVDERYSRALREVAKRPEGYTAKHIIEIAQQHPSWPHDFLVRYESTLRIDPIGLFGITETAAPKCAVATSKEARADVYNGQLFASLARGKLTFVPELNHWKRWNGNVWERCVHGEEMSFAKSVGMLLVNKATELLATDLEQGEKAMKRAIQCQGANKLEAMLKLSKSESGMSTSANKFDADLMLLGVRNGVVDLRVGTLLSADPSMLITKNCNASFNRDAQCPIWLKFLSDIFLEDTDTIETVQRALGYTLTGLNTEEKLFICVGFGSNGKSVFGNVVYQIMGDYASAASGSVLVRRTKGDTGPRDDLAGLAGCRYVGINETQSGDRLDEQVVKMMAGREPITARFMYGSNFTYVPQYTAWLRTNHRPIIVGTDDGIWRRPVIITFGRHFSDDEKDPHLEQKLMAEQDGILAWMIEGCRKYLHEGGLKLSSAVKKASADYREESDVLGEFLQTETEQDQNEKVEAGLVWRRYMGWCTEGGYRYGTKRTLSRRLTERGYQTVRSNGKDYYTGFRLTPEPLGSALSANLGGFQ